jgi:hypothetical protein
MLRNLVFLAVVLPVMADTQFRPRRMAHDGVPFGMGQCDIRLQIDDEAEVKVSGELVSVRAFSGREARDNGSECSEPFPGIDLQGFSFEIRDGRGDIVLLSPPDERNGYAAVIRIRDSASGSGLYHFRLNWKLNAFDSGRYATVPRNPFGKKEAIQVCQVAVVNRIVDQYHYGDVDIRNIHIDERTDRRDYVLGEARARRGFHKTDFTFVCTVDFDSGRVRSVEVRRARSQ